MCNYCKKSQHFCASMFNDLAHSYCQFIRDEVRFKNRRYYLFVRRMLGILFVVMVTVYCSRYNKAYDSAVSINTTPETYYILLGKIQKHQTSKNVIM